MDPIKIEAADREFVNKLHRLRSKLTHRQAQWENRSLRQSFFRNAPLPAALLLIVAAGFILFHMSRTSGPTKAGQPAAAPPVAKRPAVETPPGVPPPLAETPARDKGPTTRAASPARGPEPETVQGNIEQITTLACRGVKDHLPLGKGDTFQLAQASRVYIWMRVRSKRQPFVIRHVYYLNGHRYCEVPLRILYPRMRTWSYVSLQKAKLAGQWTVKITCKGKLLKTVSFEVNR